MKYEIGEKVLLRNDLYVNVSYGSCKWDEKMDMLKNKIVTIDKVNNFDYFIKEYNNKFYFTDEMIECKFEPTLEWCKKYGKELLYKDSIGYIRRIKEVLNLPFLKNDLFCDDTYISIVEIIQPTIIWTEADGRYIEPVEEMTPEQIYKELGRKVKIVMGGGII